MLSRQPFHLLPVIALLVSASLWGVLWYPMRLLEAEGLGGLWAMLIVFGAPMAFGLLVLWRGRQELQGLQNPGSLVLLGLAGGWANIAFILAVLEGNVVRVVLLFYLSPLWTVLFGKLILHETMSRAAKWTLAAALSGAMVMLWNGEIGFPWPQSRSDGLALSSGVAFAFSNVLVRKIQNVSIWSKSAIGWIGVVIVAGSLIILAGQSIPHVEVGVLLYAIALGLVGIVTMTWAVIYGVTHMPVHRSAVIMLFEVVVAAVSAQILTNEVVQTQEWIGGAMILAAALLATRSHAKEKV